MFLMRLELILPATDSCTSSTSMTEETKIRQLTAAMSSQYSYIRRVTTLERATVLAHYCQQ